MERLEKVVCRRMRLGPAMKATACLHGIQHKLQPFLEDHKLYQVRVPGGMRKPGSGKTVAWAIKHSFIGDNGLGVTCNVEDTFGRIVAMAIQADLLPVEFRDELFRQVRFQRGESSLYRVMKIVNQLAMGKWSIIDR